MNNRIYYRSYNCTSEVWDGWSVIPTGTTCDSPAAAVLGDSLHIVVRGFSTISEYGNNTMWHTTLNFTTASYTPWTHVTGQTSSAPTLTATETLNKVYITIQGLDNRIYYNAWNSTGWDTWITIPTGATSAKPAAKVIDTELHIVAQGLVGTGIWHYYIDLISSDHTGWIGLDGATPSSPTYTN
jgi:hypothetical protein